MNSKRLKLDENYVEEPMDCGTPDVEKLDKRGEPMYSLGSHKPIAVAYLLGCTGESVNQRVIPTGEDVRYVSDTFKKIGVKVKEERYAKGLTAGDIEQILIDLDTPDLKRYSCLIFYYSGHGDADGIYLNMGAAYPYKRIVDRVCNLATLKGKPKVFIFDSCRKYDRNKEYFSYLSKAETYPDCLVVHACSSGEVAFISGKSLFTNAFCSILRTHHQQWPLVSILTQANRITQKDLRGFYTPQTPEFEVKLLKQLYLCCDDHVETTITANQPMLLQLYHLVPELSIIWYDVGLQLLYEQKDIVDRLKASGCSDDSACRQMLREWLCVKKDASWSQLLMALKNIGVLPIANVVTTYMRTNVIDSRNWSATRTISPDNSYGMYLCEKSLLDDKSENEDTSSDNRPSAIKFLNKEDVTRQLGKLGQQQKVFICYAPSTSSSGSVDGIGKLESRVYTFARHLITYGFEVVVDLFYNFTVGFDWTTWTSHEMSQADWILCVCSNALCELMHPSNNSEVMLSLPTVKKTTPFDTTVNEVAKRVRFSGKILYNRLLNETKSRIIAVILRDDDKSHVPPVLQDPQNILHICEDMPFDYDKLDGHFERLICRMAGINRLALNNADLEQKKRYVQLNSKIPTASNTVEDVEKPVGHQETELTTTGNTFRQAENYLAMQPSASYQSSYQLQCRNADLMQSPITSSPYHANHRTTTETHAPNVCGTQMSTTHRPQNDYRTSILYSTSNSSTNVAVVGKKHCDLPDRRIPVNSPILWKLSQEVQEWKFLARYLDLAEEVITDIDHYTEPNRTRDKSLRMLKQWVDTSPGPTWRALGEALLESEDMLLYEKFLEFMSDFAV